ncbi:hypothetical protein [Bifidobacterium myosotis]|nr:hypothetical protein [Bifidobacterium myosotis]
MDILERLADHFILHPSFRQALYESDVETYFLLLTAAGHLPIEGEGEAC